MIRLLILFSILCASLAVAQSQYRPDILGAEFEQRTIDLPDEADGELSATLVRHSPIVEGDASILYIHGYNDYFYQAEMAQRICDSNYNFYALDLRRYGRSIRPENSRFQLTEVSDYFAEISQAIAIIREESGSTQPIILMGHSTGGLIVSLYASEQERLGLPRVDGLILNSPFLDMNLSPLMESIMIPAVAMVGRCFPQLVVSVDNSTAYYESLDRDHHGEWRYDTTLKLINQNPTTAGWIRAIHLAQQQIQSSPNISIPILLMHSDKSTVSAEWIPEYQTSDVVLDVDDMATYGAQLGDNVTHVVIEDGIHDLVLSGRDAREATYSAIFEWLNRESL